MVWELELGHTVEPAQGVSETVRPKAFDDPNTLAAFVEEMRGDLCGRQLVPGSVP